MEAVVEYNYVAQEDDELTLKKGDIITGIKMMLGGWWEGTLRDKRGMFPDNFVKVLEPSTTSNSSSETTKCDEVALRNGSSRRFCKVLFSYEPCNEDELTLKPQDAIEFLGEVEEGWWRGRLRGRVGVFPSNFVSDPEELGRHKTEMCQVLFPYEAANEDELTLAQGDVITLLSKDAPDKGWWKGELRGQIGLFPDNFVEIIGMKNESQEEPQWHEATLLGVKSSTRHSHQMKRNEKAHVRKSLDRSNHPSSISDHFPVIDAGKVPSTSSSHVMMSSTIIGNNDKKVAAGSHSIISSLKRLVSDVGNNNGVANATNTFSSSSSECREELDGVERGEGAPLSHLTASRAKAPRRRPPSSQHLRHAAGSAGSMLPDGPIDSDVSILSDMPIHPDVPILPDVSIQPGVPIHPHMRKHPDMPIHSGETILPNIPSSELQILQEDSSNNRTNTTLEQADEETEGLIAKTRQKTSWDAMVNELKMNQMERRKTTGSVDRVDKTEIKKERNFPRLMTQGNVVDSVNKPDTDNDDGKQKDKSPRTDRSPSWSSSGQPAYVPYVLYNKLLKRVDELEEKQAVLQMTVEQLSEQLIPLLANLSVNSKV